MKDERKRRGRQKNEGGHEKRDEGLEKGSTVRKNTKEEWKIDHLLTCTSGNKIKQEKCKNELMKIEDGE
jgi:hypothetical protein